MYTYELLTVLDAKGDPLYRGVLICSLPNKQYIDLHSLIIANFIVAS